jgi:hypothetical protein
VTCIRVLLSSRNGACCDPVSRRSQRRQSGQGTEGGLGGVSSGGGWATSLSTNKNLKRRKKC